MCDQTPSLRAVLLPLVLLLLCGPLQADQYKGFPRGQALVTATELKSMLDGPGPKPVVLAALKQVSWLVEHIPGAPPRPAQGLHRPGPGWR